MDKSTITKLNTSFEQSAYEQDGVDYWLARDLQELLGYTDWRNFLNAVDKAKESCKTTGEAVSDHFVDVNKMIPIGKGGQRELKISCLLGMLVISSHRMAIQRRSK
jgi:DNA-damage-inducible protein D